MATTALSLLLLPLLLAPCISGKTTAPKSLLTSPPRLSEDSAVARSYLAKFGYLRGQKTLGAAVQDFQAFAGLRRTGDLDEETMEKMKAPRCRNKDIEEEDGDPPRQRLIDSRKRGKPYTIGEGGSWKSMDLSYKVTKYSRGVSRGAVDETIARAFKVWEDATCFKFTKKDKESVDIEISFESGIHGDDPQDPFDGEGGTLAHAFLPIDGGKIHVDDDELWSVNSTQGTSLLMTLTHEIGHSLGLDHSKEQNSIMWASYQDYDPNLSLHDDDIRGIQKLYGNITCGTSKKPSTQKTTRKPRMTKRPSKTSTLPCCETSKKPSTPKTTQKSKTTTRPSRTSTVPETSEGDNTALCNSDHIDTIVTMSSRSSYVFLGSSYWKLTEPHGIHHPGYPRPISSDWAGLPNNLDAAFTWTNGKTYFFKGSKFWRFSDIGEMDSGYPKQLEEGFPGIPANVDAALLWPLYFSSELYFFKGSKYWKYPDLTPRPISNWSGIPDNLDAAMQYSNGKSYFFKRSKYYLYNDTADSASLGFPKETGLGWFDCSPSSIPLERAEEVV